MRKSIIVVCSFVAACLLMTGCHDKSVKLVRDNTWNPGKTVTLGRAFDNYKYFVSRSWKSHDAGNGERLVEFLGKCAVTDEMNKDDVVGFTVVFIFTVEPDNSFHLARVMCEKNYKNGEASQLVLNDGYSKNSVVNGQIGQFENKESILNKIFNNNPIYVPDFR